MKSREYSRYLAKSYLQASIRYLNRVQRPMLQDQSIDGKIIIKRFFQQLTSEVRSG